MRTLRNFMNYICLQIKVTNLLFIYTYTKNILEDSFLKLFL